jgi:hypothetical protein
VKTSNTAIILTVSYLVLTGLSIVYELSIRIYDRGNSEFAGVLSTGLTLPTSVLLIGVAESVFGVRIGDSDVAFVSILGLSALMNACIIYVIVRLLSKLIKK